MARTVGSTATNKRGRRTLLLRYFLRGVTDTHELSEALHCSERTIQLDLKDLKPWLYAKVEAERLHSVRVSFLQKREIWREIMALYHRTLEHGKESPDVFRKLRALELAMRMSREFDRIAGIGETKPPTVTVTQQTALNVNLKENIRKLPPDEQEVLAKAIRDIERTASEPN